MNPYDLLGVPHDADDKTITAAWRKLSKLAHPDRHGDGHEYDGSSQADLNQARDILLDAERRAKYDATGEAGEPINTNEQRARELLFQLMSEVVQDERLSSRFGNDVYAALLDGLSTRMTGIDMALAESKRGHERIRMLQKRIRSKDGKESIFDMLFGKFLDAQSAAIADIERDMEIAGMARTMLTTDYESAGGTVAGRFYMSLLTSGG